jgi:hypothetical protein
VNDFQNVYKRNLFQFDGIKERSGEILILNCLARFIRKGRLLRKLLLFQLVSILISGQQAVGTVKTLLEIY